ncbi:MAG TPA: CDP-glucose 4,6-dehydratase, partial [Polyangiales bacterium]
VIGGGDWTHDQLVPDVVRAFGRSEPVRLRNPHATRPWQFVLEPLKGYLMLAERLYLDGPRYAGAYNFGPADADAKPVRWMVATLARLWGPGATWTQDSGTHPHEAGYLKLDSSKAHAELNWEPRLRVEGALAWLVEWYKHLAQGGDVRAKTLEQIQAYDRLWEP